MLVSRAAAFLGLKVPHHSTPLPSLKEGGREGGSGDIHLSLYICPVHCRDLSVDGGVFNHKYTHTHRGYSHTSQYLHISSLIPRSHPAFRRLQYRRAWYVSSVLRIVQPTTRSTLGVYHSVV